MLLLKVTEVTIEQQNWPKIGQTSIKKAFFFAQRAKNILAEGQSPPQKLEVGPWSGAVPSSSLQKYRQIV